MGVVENTKTQISSNENARFWLLDRKLSSAGTLISARS